MDKNNYQVWEGEMEAEGLEEKGVSFFSVIFSAMVGIVLFVILILKTMLMGLFGLKPTPRLNARPVVRSETDSKRRQKVSYEYQKQS